MTNLSGRDTWLLIEFRNVKLSIWHRLSLHLIVIWRRGIKFWRLVDLVIWLNWGRNRLVVRLSSINWNILLGSDTNFFALGVSSHGRLSGRVRSRWRHIYRRFSRSILSQRRLPQRRLSCRGNSWILYWDLFSECWILIENMLL